MRSNIGSLRKLSLGCGRDIRPDHVNLDIMPLPGVDIVHDLNVLPLPFSDSYFEEVLCDSVLEHLPYLSVLRDIHRILMPGGRLLIQVPHFSSPSAYENPQHVRFFTSQTLSHFEAGHPNNYSFGFAFSRLELCHIGFARRWAYPWNYVLERVINLMPAMQRLYENTPLRMFPADQIRAILVK